MPFEEKLKELLVQHGMFEGQAWAIIDRVRADKSHEAMNRHWGHQVEDYPPQMLAILWLHVKREAIAYIDEVCPLAFNRPMFV